MQDLIKKVAFIELTDIVPNDWASWFYQLVSEGAPFSFGDNNRTLVTASRFLDHWAANMDIPIEDGDITEDEANNFSTMLESFGETYIDLEN
jgi:hypothetical protein